MKRHFIYAGILWLVLTIIGEIAALVDLFPTSAAEEASVTDDAFKVLMYLGVPVFTFVIAALAYSLLRFRVRGVPAEDGAPIHGHSGVERTWLVITSALAVLVIIWPGLTGLAEMREEKPVDMVVQVEGVQWAWTVRYPGEGIRARDELVLPVDTHVRFEITSLDVLHSFWVPAFRYKIDAVPGQVTTLNIKPTKTGSYEDDAAFRLQCAELCGLDHSRMMIPVRVVSQEEFAAWVASKKQ